MFKAGGSFLNQKSTRRTLVTAPSLLRATEPIRMRISVATPATHGRTIAATDFHWLVSEDWQYAIKTELFHRG
jgi:TRAP-type C4-dicarboxylate transport system substrate-binding protein